MADPLTNKVPAALKHGVLGFIVTLKLAWRNLARNRKRTSISAITVAFAVFLLQLSYAMLIGLEDQSFDNLINYQTGHAKIFAAGYFEEREDLTLDHLIRVSDSLQHALAELDGVAGAAPRITFAAQLSDGSDQLSVLGVGIQPAGSDDAVFRIRQAIVGGRYLDPEDEGLLLGSGLAEFFEAGVGDWLTVLAKTKNGAYEALDLEVIGLIGTGNPAIDRNTIMMPLDVTRYMLDMESEATEIALRFASASRSERTLQRVSEVLGEEKQVDLKSWQEVEEDFEFT